MDAQVLTGAVFVLLAVKPLFKEDSTASTIHSVLYDEIQPPSSHRPQVCKELDEIVLKALRRNPEERWQTAREMGRALRKFLGTQEHVIGPAELSEWMGEVFPQGMARKSELMERARSVPALSQVSETAPTQTPAGVRLIEDEPLASKPVLARRVGFALAMLGAVATAAVIASGFGETKGGAGTEALPQTAALAPPMEVAETVETLTVEPAAEAPQSKRRARPQPGTINLVTRGGWAEIYKGKQSLGSTPRRLTLPSGRHKFVLKPFGGGKSTTVYVNVEANKTKKVSVGLD